MDVVPEGFSPSGRHQRDAQLSTVRAATTRNNRHRMTQNHPWRWKKALSEVIGYLPAVQDDRTGFGLVALSLQDSTDQLDDRVRSRRNRRSRRPFGECKLNDLPRLALLEDQQRSMQSISFDYRPVFQVLMFSTSLRHFRVSRKN